MGSNRNMTTTSGGQPPNIDNRFIFKANDFPDNLANKRPCSTFSEDFVMVNGQRQRHESKFLLVSHANESLDLSKTSPFIIQKGLDQITKCLKNIKKLRSGQLLVETKYSSQIEKLLSATTLSGIVPIKVELHPHLNLSKGIVYAPDLINIDEETLGIELNDQKVTEVKRIRRLAHEKDTKVDIDSDGFVQTPLLIITFNSTVLPKKLKAAYLMLNVEPYIPNPMRCKQCQRFGHTKKRCVQKPACARCSLEHDDSHIEGVLCNNNPQCANCHGPHEAFRKSCKKFKEEYAISKIKTVDRLTYKEAKDKFAMLNPVNYMIPTSEIVKMSNSAFTPPRPTPPTQRVATMFPSGPSGSHERPTSPRRNNPPKKQIDSGRQRTQGLNNDNKPTQQQKVRQPTPIPEPLSQEKREMLLQKLQDQKNKQEQQTINSQQNNQNQQAEQAQRQPKDTSFDFAIPSPRMEIDRGESDYESSSSNKSTNSVKKRITKNHKKHNNQQ